MTSKGDIRLDDTFLLYYFKTEILYADQNKLLPDAYILCRNFDEVLSSFVEPLMESASFSESCSGLYEEENFKVSIVALSPSFY